MYACIKMSISQFENFLKSYQYMVLLCIGEMENNYVLKLLHILASFMVFSLTIAKSLMAAVAFKHLIRFPKIRCFQCIFLQELV